MIAEWREFAPWVEDAQVEQDLFPPRSCKSELFCRQHDYVDYDAIHIGDVLR